MPKVGSKKFAYTPKGEAKAKVYAKKTGKKIHYTQKMDDAYDKSHGIQEGSKKDKVLDKKRGLAEKPMKKKVHVVVIAPKKVMKNKMPLPIPVPMPMGPVKKLGKLKNPSIYR